MTYSITQNTDYNSLEITFDGKPCEAVRDALKALRFRWHGQKKCWYGYTDEATARAAIEGKADNAEQAGTPEAVKPAVNRFSVQVGDIFHASWGYDQTNNDFFQVVALCGESSVRVREVYPHIVDRRGVSGMSEDRTVKLSRELLPPASFSVFIKDQEHGDLKRLKSYAADGKSNPCFKLNSFASASLCTGDTLTVYESWYA